MRRFLRWLAPLFFVGALCLPAAAQSASQSDPQQPEKGVHVPALEYTVAFLFVILVMVIICKPSRKG
jgi:hypothetical protein